MSNQIEFFLNNQQVEYIQMKLPQGFSLHLSSLVHSREQRISKKVSRFDATFKSNKLEQQNIEEQFQKRSSRPQITREQKEIENRGLKILTKFKSHPYFDEIYDTISDRIDIDQLKMIKGNLQGLQNELKKFIKTSYQVNSKNVKVLEHIYQLETLYCELFKLPQPKKKQQPQQQQQQQQQQQVVVQQQLISKMQKPMSMQEKLALGENIRQLKPEYLRGVWELVRDIVPSTSDIELEFDIDTLPIKIARKLESYVLGKLQQQKPLSADEEEKSIDPESSEQ